MKGIVYGWLIAGVLDISDAFIYTKIRGGQPIRVLYYISSALLGPDAMKGGFWLAVMGMSIHFGIALAAAAVYYVVSVKLLPVLGRHPVPWGIAYGVLWYGLMNYVVLPMTRVKIVQPNLIGYINGIGAIALLVGLPIALCVYRNSFR